MFALGTLGVLQMVLLPGLLCRKFFKIRSNVFSDTVIVFGLSLFINYLLIFLLTPLHLFSQAVMLGIVAAELVILVFIYKDTLLISFEAVLKKLQGWLSQVELFRLGDASDSAFSSVIEKLLFLLSIILASIDIVWMANRFINNIGTVFNSWDAVVSWNVWAIEWARGIIPNSSIYPQLITANWAISYVLLGGIPLQIFAKIIMPLFSLLMLVMLFDLGLRNRSFGILLGVLFTRLVIKKFTGEFISDGYMDLPATFFGFASVYFLLIGENTGDKKYLVILSALFATAAALTKQAGIFSLLMFPLLAFLLTKKNAKEQDNKELTKTILISFGIGLLIALSWYLLKWIRIQSGNEFSNVSYVTQGIYSGASYVDRAINAVKSLSKYAYFLAYLVVAIFFVPRQYKWITAFVIFPYTLIWMFFFSYEPRNLALIFPFWGLVIGVSLQQIYTFSMKLLQKINFQKIPVVTLLGILILGIGALTFHLSNEKLNKIENDQLWTIFNPELNSMIRETFSDNSQDVTILTNYPVNALPGLSGTQLSFSYNNLDDFLWAMKNLKPDYLLVPSNADDKVESEIQNQLQEGKLFEKFSADGGYSYTMYQVDE